MGWVVRDAQPGIGGVAHVVDELDVGLAVVVVKPGDGLGDDLGLADCGSWAGLGADVPVESEGLDAQTEGAMQQGEGGDGPEEDVAGGRDLVVVAHHFHVAGADVVTGDADAVLV